MKSLILAEKPSVGKDIANALNINTKRNGYFENNNYIVTWALGHLVTNATPEQYDKYYKEWKLADLPIIPNKMKTVVISKTKKQFQTVQGLLQRNEVQNIIIATDAGREGELVARLILDKAHNKKPIKRLWISSVTKKAIIDGFKKLKDGRQFNHLYEAALARSEADWVVGINATRALTTKYDAQLSLGRVQTPTIKLVEMRQSEINNFTPETYYTLNINVDGLQCQCITPQQSSTKEVYENAVNSIKGHSAIVNSINRKSKKAFPPKLFNLTDLQQEAYKRYHYGPKETLNTLQQLYERHKLVTYPRTDANYLTDDMVSTIKDRLRALMATEYKAFAKAQMSQSYSANDHYINNNKVSDHHAIIPTEVRPNIEALSLKEQKIYMIIAQRFLANLMPPQEYEAIELELVINDYKFVYKDKISTKLGFKALFNSEEKPFILGSKWQQGANINVSNVNINEHETTPPSYFNEGSLLKAMESPQKFFKFNNHKHNKTLKEAGGIGTVATRADIIEKLFNMNAIESREGKIKVTSKGQQILELAPEQLTSPLLTAQWEDKLMMIEQGKYDSRKFMDEIKSFTDKIITTIKNSEQKYKHDNLTTTECPTCGKFMLKVNTKNGSMLVCQDPNCKTKKNVQSKTNARCPNCHKKMTRFGTNKDAVYRCVCGHTETQIQMDKRYKSKKTEKVSKKDMKKYLNNDEGVENNPFQDALKGLKF
ncbi:DNA topoisomerase III [Staphylococcus durrellii]|uniref:DNA topoisomerase III n=1 Tax=Staphylococcus durrellii TaxID=2781773 RepID=UPI00189D3234|nr:DNA topoisomerase III [Staphylococcus durrellii]MBF7016458.1 DNA topoisomerase III [Staphylococcus durrellii]